jgi:hypothetical protein
MGLAGASRSSKEIICSSNKLGPTSIVTTSNKEGASAAGVSGNSIVITSSI